MLPIVFFKKKSSFINTLFSDFKSKKNTKVNNINTLKKSKKFDLTFFDSIKYKSHASNTKASFCITTNKLEKFLPQEVENNCKKCFIRTSKSFKKNVSRG